MICVAFGSCHSVQPLYFLGNPPPVVTQHYQPKHIASHICPIVNDSVAVGYPGILQQYSTTVLLYYSLVRPLPVKRLHSIQRRHGKAFWRWICHSRMAHTYRWMQHFSKWIEPLGTSIISLTERFNLLNMFIHMDSAYSLKGKTSSHPYRLFLHI